MLLKASSLAENITEMFSKTRLLSALAVMWAYTVAAQNFSYSLVKDSSSFTCLTGANVLVAGENFLSNSYGIHLPFTFNFCGISTDSITVEGNGFISFDASKGLSTVAFNNFSSRRDTSNNYLSSIVYKIEGSGSNRVFIVEFKNMAQNRLSQYDHLDYQVWLYENGNKIEFHIGNNSNGGQELPQLIGLINRNMDTESKAFILSGDPGTPGGNLITGDNEFVYLDSFPSAGLIYKLIPSF
ncbi:MAG: remA [Bacteroidetes bacterium]|nr:remA [Bacteroidota bacterium]